MKIRKQLICLVLLLLAMTSRSQVTGKVGIGTTTPEATLHIAEYGDVMFGSDTSGSGPKFMWVPQKYAFRAGQVGYTDYYPLVHLDSTIWEYKNLGVGSFATGFQNIASGYGTVAMGARNKAAGVLSSAIGGFNTIMGDYGVSIGYSNGSVKERSVCIGTENYCSDERSVMIGYGNNSLSSFSSNIGMMNIISGWYGVALGTGNQVLNPNGGAIGSENTVWSMNGITVGYRNLSRSFGCFVAGMYSDTIAGSQSLYWKSTDPIFIIGNGQSNVSRKNALVVRKDGRVGINTNMPSAELHVYGDNTVSNPTLTLEESASDYVRVNFKNLNPGYWRIEGYAQQLFGDNAGARFNFFFSLNDYIFSLRGNGNAVLTGILFQNSDALLKRNITPILNPMQKLSRLHGYTYQWIDQNRGNEQQIGLLAQEVELEFPELVSTDEEGRKSVAYANLVPVLIEAIQEQQREIASLREMILQVAEGRE